MPIELPPKCPFFYCNSFTFNTKIEKDYQRRCKYLKQNEPSCVSQTPISIAIISIYQTKKAISPRHKHTSHYTLYLTV